MEKIYLDDRLMSVVSLLDKHNIIADIGCDHGLLSNYVIQNNLVKKALATEVSEQQMDLCRKNTHKYNNLDRIKFLIGKGLNPILEYDVDTIIICGMGGELIIKILKENLNYIKNKTLILQPQKNTNKVRKFLRNNGFRIIEEKIEEVNEKFYFILKVKNGYQKPCYNDLIGKSLVNKKNKKLKRYLENQISINDCILSQISNASSLTKRKESILKEQKLYKEILNEIKT